MLRTGKYRFNRTAPLIFSPVDPHALYLGSNVLFVTRDGGNSWQIVSPDLTREDPGVPATLGPFVNDDPAKGKHRGVIYSVAPSPKDANLIWIGTDDGLIQITHDGGKTWQNITPPDLTPWSKVAQMDASHFDTPTAYAAINRFRLDDLHPYIYRTHDNGKTWQKIVTGLPENEPVNTVREDPERKGLLFAGTERSVYVSFDDGDHWQSLKQNLPPTSIRDLVVHNDDIVVGTHGRSFWILDNITPLRRTRRTKYRSHERGPFCTATHVSPAPRQLPRYSASARGTCRPKSAGWRRSFDYWVRTSGRRGLFGRWRSADRLPGALVRQLRFSSTDKPEEVNPKDINVPMYWVRPPRVLSVDPGHAPVCVGSHLSRARVVIPRFPHLGYLSRHAAVPQGATVLPGKYMVRLKVAERGSVAQPNDEQRGWHNQILEIRLDPRVKTSPEDLRRQFDLDRKIAEALHRDHEALQQIRSLRSQIKWLQRGKYANSAASSTALDGAAKIAADLDTKAAALEGTEGGYGSRFMSTHEGRSLARLNGGFGTMLSQLDTADAAPTTQELEMFRRVGKSAR